MNVPGHRPRPDPNAFPRIDNPVLAPNHYTHGGIETIDFIRAKLSGEALRGYYLGNIIKYMSRAQFKNENGLEDYAKAAVYLQWLVELEKISPQT